MIKKNRLKFRKKSSIVFVFFALSFGCKRIEKTDENSGQVAKKLEISSIEIQRILDTKANLESVQVSDDIKFSIPENYYFRTRTIDAEEIDSDSKFGKLDLATKNSYDYVEIKNSMFINNEISDERINVIKDDNPNLLTINDLKADYEIETIYFEDEKSIVFSEDKTFTTLHFQYDLKSKNYLIYTGSIRWAKAFPLEDKLDLAFYFLRNARNLLSTNFTKQEFSWKDYVNNRPKLETNLMKDYFKNFKKEMNTFLDVNESSIPTYDNYSLVKLYRMPPGGDVLFYQALNNLELGKFDEAQRESWINSLIYTDDKCKLLSKGNSSILEITQVGYDGVFMDKKSHVFSIIEYNKKQFLLISENKLNEKQVDFFVKMFNYYSQYYTLDLANKK